MYKVLPDFDIELGQQDRQSPVSDRAFEDNLTPSPITGSDRVIQILLFIFSLGWLRVLILIVVSCVELILLIPVLIFYENPGVLKYVRPVVSVFMRVYMRIMYFCMGIYSIRRRGDIDKSARACAFNHQSLFDGPLLWMFHPFLVIGMIELKKIPLINRLLIAAPSVFVDRVKTEGLSAIMKSLLEDHSGMPLALAPEGKTTKGHFMLSFRTGGFLSKELIQPVTIRYHMYGAFGGATYAWIVGGFKEWLWRVFCVPFSIVEIHYLPVLEGEKYFSGTPKERALECQLIMANDLGVLASDRTAHGLIKQSVEKAKIE
jgi:1-acyl-sn-glycerol-3-phosphate acyltransferase